MSLQRRVPLPPLALGIHPAPPRKVVDKEKEKADEKKAKEAAAEKAKVAEAGKDKEVNKVEEGKDNKKNGKEDMQVKVNKEDTGKVSPALADLAPGSPGSMVPEPGTPGTYQTAAAPAMGEKDGKIITPDLAVPAVPGPQAAKPLEHTNNTTEAKDTAAPKADITDEPLPPIRLLGPAPPRPLRTTLDLNPGQAYPPIPTDPRGAYYKYAKYNQGQVIYIDVVKDGWLAPQWQEKAEREALARLKGESEVVAQREAERVRALTEVRKVPEKAEDILVQLWNDLVQAGNHECMTGDFWSRYDWSDPAAQKHLLPAKRAPETEDAKEAGNAEDVQMDQKDQANNDTGDSKVDPLSDVEWTREGLEEILGTVGVMCSYNTPKPLPRSYHEPAGAYLILGHGFFMLRTEDILQWKSEEAANKFEVLVTSGHDRVFGEMVKAQQAEERKRKEKEYKERKLREKAEEEKRKKAEGDGKGDSKGEGKAEGGKKAAGEDKVKEAKARDTPKEIQGDNAEQVNKGQDGKLEPKQPQAEGIAVQGDHIAIAVPVQAQDVQHKGEADKHEVEVLAAAPGEATQPKAAADAKAAATEEKAQVGGDKPALVKGHGNKDANANHKVHDNKAHATKPFDPVREAELLAKMVAAGKTPPGVGMDDIKLAFKALEAAAGADGAKAAAKKQEPVIWTWHDSCERWRWRNFEAGLHEVGPGGWEERDWRVFADDRGCDEFEEEEEWAEALEQDLHDWSL